MGRRHRTAGPNTTRQSANVAAFDSRQSPRSASQSPNRAEMHSQAERTRLSAKSQDRRPKTVDWRLKTEDQTWPKASRPHPHTSLFLCRLWWYDLNDKRGSRRADVGEWIARLWSQTFGDRDTTSTENSTPSLAQLIAVLCPARLAKRQI